MRITKKLVAKTCLPVYYEVMDKGKDMNEDDFYYLLNSKFCIRGICYLYRNLAKDRNIYDFAPLDSVFIIFPSLLDEKSEILECIQVRIDLLESWLK